MVVSVVVVVAGTLAVGVVPVCFGQCFAVFYSVSLGCWVASEPGILSVGCGPSLSTPEVLLLLLLRAG